MGGLPAYVLLAAAAIALALPLLWWSVAGARGHEKAVARTLAGTRGPMTDLRTLTLTRSARERAVRPVVGALAARARRLTPVGFVDALERRSLLAGVAARWPVERLLAAKLLLGLGGVGLGLLLLVTDPGLGRVAWAVVLGVIGFFVPDLILYSRARERQQRMRLELPDTLDQLTICVEAGLGFEAAMAHAGRTGEGPLADEVVRTLQEVQLGVPRWRALRNLVERTEVDDLRHFVLAVLQAEEYGVPIAQVLRVQAGELRVKRRQRAEERAMKVPVKVVFPLVLCILPTLFIILVGPAAIRIADSLLFGGPGG